MSNFTNALLKPTQLRLLHEIAAHGQLQLAAMAISVSQPAASRMLADIEKQLGTPLFHRLPVGMEPTDAGRIVLRRTNGVLREMQSIITDVAELRAGKAGSVSVGAVTGPAVSYLVSAIHEVKRIAPSADITADVMPSRELLQNLVEGKMDFVLARVLPDFDGREFDIMPMRDEKIAFLVRDCHPLTRASSVSLADLSNYEWILQQRGSPIREATITAFANAGLPEPDNIINSPSMLMSIAYLAQSDAIAPMAEEVAALLVRPPVSAGFVKLDVPLDIRVAPYFLLNLRRRPLSPLAARLREKLMLVYESTAAHLVPPENDSALNVTVALSE